MLLRNRKPKTTVALRQRQLFHVGDRVKTSNHYVGTVVRVDRDEVGEYIVARLDEIPQEFAYDPDDLLRI
ncbi:hypothetical protein [Desulfosporosinus hippei]|uniref:Uncharacterized protein n=1 Tax=Desulfosporosinus hippei DSM 8344 TaxID=1121419 RepID=A0A1G7TC31_9FIRM|nr:hypothetical protein [Desulfosporosinus hippei]SDG32853.1 hypothetical protein SAMN05443529_102180 [Desulfosporosinus hippei DSM 8344]